MDKHRKKRLQRRAKDILNRERIGSRVAGIDAFVLALETIHEDPNLAASFSYEHVLGSADNVHAALKEHLDPRYLFTLTALSDWQSTLIERLPNEALGFTTLTAPVRQRLIETLTILLARATGDAAVVYHVEIDTAGGPFYEASSEDYLFVTPSGLHLLHFGLSD